MNSVADGLIQLAGAKFLDLTDAERILLGAAASGKVARCSDQTVLKSNQTDRETSGNSCTINARVIRWLCVDHEAVSHIDPKGILIDAANIDQELDLTSVAIPCPLVLRRCAIPAGMNLERAETRFISLEGSFSGPIRAAGLIVHGAIHLGNGFRADGEVGLYGANISGDLVCEGGVFLNTDGRALNIGAAKVGGDVLLRDGFRAQGEVALYRTAIIGDLRCDGGVFLNRGKRALNADSVAVGGGVFLRKSSRGEGFRAEGEVGLYRATVGKDLTCDGGIFLNRHGRALGADGITVGGTMQLRNGFQAEGEVGLHGAKIGGDLTCDGGVFLNSGKRALNAGGATV
jgi:hypothetical protein